jgi:hypothetical protein
MRRPSGFRVRTAELNRARLQVRSASLRAAVAIREDVAMMKSAMHDAILYQFSRDLVEVGDATDFLKRFGRHRLPVGRQLGAMMNHLAMFIEGYDDDPREIYAIPEVRKF